MEQAHSKYFRIGDNKAEIEAALALLAIGANVLLDNGTKFELRLGRPHLEGCSPERLAGWISTDEIQDQPPVEHDPPIWLPDRGYWLAARRRAQ